MENHLDAETRPALRQRSLLRRLAIRALDRRGGRWILEYLTTRMAQQASPGAQVRFLRDMWTHRVGGFAFVDSPQFPYYAEAFRAWPRQAARVYSDSEDFWFTVYKPSAGDTIVDIGAGRGEDAIAFSRAVGPGGRVLGIEAHPETYRCFEALCALNHLDNMTPIHCAVTDTPGWVAIATTGNYWSNSIVTDAEGSARVQSVPLDELIERHAVKRIDFLKMNIEGAETIALGGMTRAFSITRTLCISCHDFRANRQEGEHFRTKALIQEAVRREGFRIVPRDSDPRPYIADQVSAVRETNGQWESSTDAGYPYPERRGTPWRQNGIAADPSGIIQCLSSR